MGSGQSTPKITPQDRAILDLKLQRDKLKQYQRKIQFVLDREQQIAKECLASGQKEKALTALRSRKYQETMLSRTYVQLENLEQMVSTVEFSQIEQSVLHGLKQGNDVLAAIHKEMSIESVEKLLADTQDARDYQKEIDTLLAENITVEDEESVQEELLQLQTEMLTSKLPNLSGAPLPETESPQVATVQKESTEPESRIALEA